MIDPTFEARLDNWGRVEGGRPSLSAHDSPAYRTMLALRLLFGPPKDEDATPSAPAGRDADLLDAAVLSAAYADPRLSHADKMMLRLRFCHRKPVHYIARKMHVRARTAEANLESAARVFQRLVEELETRHAPP